MCMHVINKTTIVLWYYGCPPLICFVWMISHLDTIFNHYNHNSYGMHGLTANHFTCMQRSIVPWSWIAFGVFIFTLLLPCKEWRNRSAANRKQFEIVFMTITTEFLCELIIANMPLLDIETGILFKLIIFELPLLAGW